MTLFVVKIVQFLIKIYLDLEYNASPNAAKLAVSPLPANLSLLMTVLENAAFVTFAWEQ